MIDRDKKTYNIINNVSKQGALDNGAEAMKRAELANAKRKELLNPFIFSIGGVAGDSTFSKGRKIFEHQSVIKKPEFIPLEHAYGLEGKSDSLVKRVEPSKMDTAGMPSKYVYIKT